MKESKLLIKCRLPFQLNHFVKPGALFLVLVLFHVSAFSNSPDKKKLQTEYARIQEDIRQMEKLISETKKLKSKSTAELQSLNAKIVARQKLLQNINNQIQELSSEINSLNSELNQNQAVLNEMKRRYANMLREAYLSRDFSRTLLYILSSINVSEAFHRYIYLKRFGERQSIQAERIKKQNDLIQSKTQSLKEVANSKEEAMILEQKQQTLLLSEKESAKKMIKQLSKDEMKLKAGIKKKNQEAGKLNAQIQKIIEREIEDARKRAADENKKKGTGNTASNSNSKSKSNDDYLSLTPAEAALSRDFYSNRAKLPWPVEKGHVISHFGKHMHPSANVYVDNNGIDIRTNTGAKVRSVFEGQVISVFFMPFNQNSVIIKHGEYFSVYSYLTSVLVKPNSNVETKQSIGTAYTNPEEDVTLVHLEIWKGKVKMDPETWLAGI